MKILKITIIVNVLISMFNLSYADDNSKKLDAFLNEHLQKIKAPGFSTVIVKDNKILFSKGYGNNVIGKKSPVSENTVMSIGSVTKSITAMAILQLEEKGLLSTDDLVIKYLPWFRAANKEKSDKIKIKMCLNNTTGIVAAQETLIQNMSTEANALEKNVKKISSYQINRSPGESFEYLNEGWNILGLIIEKVTGLSYEQYIAEKIFKPLSMTKSSMDKNTIMSLNPVFGHYAGIIPNPATFIHIKGSLPAGSGTYMNAENLGHYLQALLNGGKYNGVQVLTDKSIQKMWTPSPSLRVIPYELGGTGNADHYGMGWFILDIAGETYIGHGGEFRTMSSMVLIDFKNKLAVGLLYNTGTLNSYTSQSSYYASLNILRILKNLSLSNFAIPREKDPTLNKFLPVNLNVNLFKGIFISTSGKRIDIKAGGSEGLQIFLNDSIYPADYDLDFISSSQFVLRNTVDNISGFFTQAKNGDLVSINIGGEIYSKKKEINLNSVNYYKSNSNSYAFNYDKDWILQWLGNNFFAKHSKKDDFIIKGEVLNKSYENVKADIIAQSKNNITSELTDLFNGYFFRIINYDDLDSLGKKTQSIALYCTYGNINYLFTLTVPQGELTSVIMNTLNPFLNSLSLNSNFNTVSK